MAGTGGINFGVAKESLRLVTDNGVRDTDVRVMRRCNEATQELLGARKADGTTVAPVGAFATYDVLSVNDVILLPAQLENAIHTEVINGAPVNGLTDVVRGWNTLVDNNSYLDPTMSHDNPMVDQFLQPDPIDATILRRQYRYPGIANGTTVRVIGRKRYYAITQDSDYLIIQNIPAMKLMVQCIERREARNAITEGQAYKEEALRLLADEAANHMVDPQNALARKASYQTDVALIHVGTLGYVRARLALELPGMLMLGKSELNYFVNEAVEEAVKHFNFLGRTERYSLVDGPNQLTLVAAVLPTDVLTYFDFEVLRLLVIAQRTPPTGSSLTTTPATPPQDSTPARQQAFALIERNMAKSAEEDRTATHVANLALYPSGTLGYVIAKLGLEEPDALQYTINRIGAFVNEAVREAVDQFNFLGRTERYSLEDGPNQLVLVPAVALSDVLTFGDYEILRLLVRSQWTKPTAEAPPQDAAPAREQAFALIERNMAQAAESSREAAHLANLGLYDVGSKGYIVSRIGLEMPGALNYTLNRLGAMVERAEARCMEMGLYKGCIDEFDATIASGNVLFPAQVEGVLACAIDGCHVDVRSIFFRYQQAGPGWCDQSSEILEDQGEQLLSNGARRRSYRVRATITAQVAPPGQTTIIPSSKIVAVCKLKSIIGRPLAEQMSIRNITALMAMTDAMISNDPNKQTFAKKILDDELSGYLAGVKHTLPFLTDGYGFQDIGAERW